MTRTSRSSASTRITRTFEPKLSGAHRDVKKMGRIPPGGGHKAHGRSEEVRGRGLGYDFIHSMIDDHSRYAYSEVLDDELGTTCAAFFLRATRTPKSRLRTAVTRFPRESVLAAAEFRV